MCAKAWEDIRPESLSHGWNKLLICASRETNSPGTPKDSDDDVVWVISHNDPDDDVGGGGASADPDGDVGAI